jgi:hypothetical protein
MRYSKTSLLLTTPLASLLLLFTLAATPDIFAANDNTPNTATAALDEEADDTGYEETARVVRVSMLRGDVSLRRAGSNSWEKAALNLPLVEGDRLATGADARLEIQIDARNFVRLGEYATLDIVTLRDEGVAFSLPEGTATLRLANFDSKREYFEIDAPKTTLAAEQKGSYRLDVAQNGNVRVTVREGGRARLYSETSGFTLRDGRTAELVYQNDSTDGDWELAAARSFDQWDTWVDERERYLASRLRYDRRDRYYDNDVWGAEELDAYGDWVDSGEYGRVWRPHVTVINNYHDWAPYRYGHWRWVSPYGWTWVADEPWGWAPYHYGRWVYVNNYWCWAPRGYAHYSGRSRWRPALVAFVSFGSSYDNNVCWYPLGYHQRDPHSNFYRRHRDRILDQRRLANLDRVNPIYQRAVTTVPSRDFGRFMVRGKPATKELALRAVTTDPLRGKLPIRPVEADLRTPGGASGQTPVIRERKGDSLLERNPTDPSRVLVERKTGASQRKPGLALDEELRRGRIYNNREPRKIDRGGDMNGGGSNANGTGGERGNRKNTDGFVSDENRERKTGAVARPARPIRMPDGASSSGDGGMTTDMPASKRPERKVDPEDVIVRPRPNVNDGGERPERKVRPIERPSDDVPTTTPDTRRERPAAREEKSRPIVRERPAREVYRPAPEMREERKTQREERSAPREERSAPREERSSPPPQREERRESPPPAREERRADPPRERAAPPPPRPTQNKGRPDDND